MFHIDNGRFFHFVGLGATLAMSALVVGCAYPEPTAESVGTADAAIKVGQMIVYEAGHPVSEDDLVDLGPPASLGGTVLEGHPKISARIDYNNAGLLAGVFQATTGKIHIHFPFTEHATILDGEVTLTDPVGHTHHFQAGDSYLIQQGTDILWEVRGCHVQKSFIDHTAPTDSAGPMIVYEKGSVVPSSALADLGPPSNLGGTVLEGHPAISARFDESDGPLIAGVFQATPGEILIDFPFTEHATVSHNGYTLTDQSGMHHTFSPGDSYLILQGSSILWNVDKFSVQKSFFSVTQP
jgi:uncharacterized cupin superfamily protein